MALEGLVVTPVDRPPGEPAAEQRTDGAMGDQGDDMTRSTIVAAHGQLFIRTNKKLYCIGKNSDVALAK